MGEKRVQEGEEGEFEGLSEAETKRMMLMSGGSNLYFVLTNKSWSMI